jgi:AcrR family transcriptional regulator
MEQHSNRKTIETPAEGTRARDRQREETRRRLFDAAMTVFRRDGVNAARIEDIAEIAGVSRGSFYFHFPTKEEVLADLLVASGDRVATSIEALSTDVPIRNVLETVSQALTKEWENDLRIFPEVATVALRMVAAGPIAESQQEVRSTLAARFEKAMERNELVSEVPASVIADIFLINQFATIIAWSGSPSMPLVQMLTGMGTLFMNGARGRAA